MLPPRIEAAFVFFPHDSGSRWEAECTELQEKHLAKLEEAFQKPQVVEFDLIHDSAGPFVDDVVDELLRSETRRLLIEAQTAPGGRLDQSSNPLSHHTGDCSLINPVECPIVVDRFRTTPLVLL